MNLASIVIVPGSAEARVVTSDGTRLVPIRIEGKFDEFAAELRLHTDAEIRVEDGPDLPAPAAGTIWICRPDVLRKRTDRQTCQLARTVVVGIERTRALEWAERLGLAAAVDMIQFLGFRGRGAGKPATLYGRKDVARRFGATWPALQTFQAQRYAPLAPGR